VSGSAKGDRKDRQRLKPSLGSLLRQPSVIPDVRRIRYESLLVKLAEIGVRPHRDDLNKRAYVVWHRLPDELVIKAESFYRDDWWASLQPPSPANDR